MKKILSLLALCMTPFALFAEEGAAGGRQSGGVYQTLIMIGIAVLFFYFILWRPERKRRKKMEEQRASLKKGDKVTAMGIIGTVDRMTEQTVILKMVDGAKIEILKAAINDVQAASETSSQEA